MVHVGKSVVAVKPLSATASIAASVADVTLAASPDLAAAWRSAHTPLFSNESSAWKTLWPSSLSAAARLAVPERPKPAPITSTRRNRCERDDREHANFG